ncbi:MAG: tRNA lysidine(34) synthetase TilS [Calditrichaeota bacterium]|nr:tRNA lysidine(34) synthetase TilS [Calditrichota bacterium]
MIKRLLSFCQFNQLISPNDAVFIALSGGMDSMALLHAFLSLKENFPLQIKAIHVNHGVRGEEADRDEQFVRGYCRQNGIELIVKQIEHLNAESGETELREARYLAFEEVLSQFPAAKIATAHTLDDNIETVLMRLAKGSSLKGLCGIPVKRGPYIRPFLFLNRIEIKKYVDENNIPFVRDSSNENLRYLRNQIRHQIIPAFRQVFGETFFDGMERSINWLNDYYKLFKKEFEQRFKEVVSREDDSLVINIEKYKELDTLYRSQTIVCCISEYYPLNYSFSKTYFEEIDKFINSARVGSVKKFRRGLFLLKDREQVKFLREHPHLDKVLKLDRDSEVRFGKYVISVKRVNKDEVKFSRDGNVEYVCGKKLHFPLLVRKWQTGDRFFPLGLGKSQKLKEFFINQKIDLAAKQEIPIVCNGNEIVWIGGLRLDDRYKIKQDCEIIYRLTLKKLGT